MRVSNEQIQQYIAEMKAGTTGYPGRCQVEDLYLDLAEARAKLAALRKDAERYKWRPISEAHEDHGECVYLNINDPGDTCLAHVCDLDYEEKVKRMTHFALSPKFRQAEYEELIAAQRQKEGKADGSGI